MRNVIVLGSGRSGTSMVCGCLAARDNAAGYHFGENLVEARPTNPKGFYESRVINALNERIMQPAMPARREDDDAPAVQHIPLPRQYWLANLPPDRALGNSPAVVDEIKQHCAAEPFCYKDPRFCYTLDAWRPHLPAGTCFVCVFRHPAETAASIMKELAEQRYLATLTLSREQVLDTWCAMYANVLDQLSQRGDWLFVHYQHLLAGDGLDRLAAFTGAPVDRSFPEGRLHRSRATDPVTPQAEAVYERLVAAAERGPDHGSE